MLPIISNGLLYLAGAIETIAAVLIGLASLQCAATAARLLLRRGATTAAKEEVRLQFGLWLSLAIEFELAADILRTTVAPSWEEIGKLASNRRAAQCAELLPANGDSSRGVAKACGCRLGRCKQRSGFGRVGASLNAQPASIRRHR